MRSTRTPLSTCHSQDSVLCSPPGRSQSVRGSTPNATPAPSHPGTTQPRRPSQSHRAANTPSSPATSAKPRLPNAPDLLGVLFPNPKPRRPRVLRPTTSSRRSPPSSAPSPSHPVRRHPPRLSQTPDTLRRTHRLGPPNRRQPSQLDICASGVSIRSHLLQPKRHSSLDRGDRPTDPHGNPHTRFQSGQTRPPVQGATPIMTGSPQREDQLRYTHRLEKPLEPQLSPYPLML